MPLPSSILERWAPILDFFADRGRRDWELEDELDRERLEDEERRRIAERADAEGPPASI